jgi:hypothetical protein
MMGITRGFSTLVGAAVAGFLIWLAVQIGTETSAEYWGAYGLIAAAGLAMALSQILGGWTKWGWPRLSAGVFLLGFLPVLVVGGWVLLARQPADFFNTSNWSRDAGIMGPVGDLGEALAAIAFLIGLTFGFVFDTEGRRRDVVADEQSRYTRERRGPAAVPAAGAGAVGPPRHDDDGRPERVTHADERSAERRPAADEPLTAERHEQAAAEPEQRGRRFCLRRRAGSRHGEDA